jgi:hypothetical protein
MKTTIHREMNVRLMGHDYLGERSPIINKRWVDDTNDGSHKDCDIDRFEKQITVHEASPRMAPKTNPPAWEAGGLYLQTNTRQRSNRFDWSMQHLQPPAALTAAG